MRDKEDYSEAVAKEAKLNRLVEKHTKLALEAAYGLSRDVEYSIETIRFQLERYRPVKVPDGKYYKVPIPTTLRWEVFKRDGFRCLVCGSQDHLRADHIIPESKGGQASLDNLQTLCRSCNSKKKTKVPLADEIRTLDAELDAILFR